MKWILDSFKTYCAKQGYDLVKDDLKFIEKSLNLLPSDKQKLVLFEYSKRWQQAMDGERDSNKRQSVGRRAANLFLLKYTGGNQNES